MSQRDLSNRLFLLTILFCAPAALAEERPETTDPTARISELERSIDELKHWRFHHTSLQRQQPSVTAGYSFLFAKLHFHESFQAISTNTRTGTLSLIPFENSFELTPRIWFGYENANGTGVRATYWNYDHNGDPLSVVNDGTNIPSAVSTTVIFPATITTALPGDVLTVNSGMAVTTLDLEGTKCVTYRRIQAALAGGLRYAKAEQDYQARVSGGPVPNVVPASLTTFRGFEGFGPTVSATANLPWRDSGLYATGNARVSFLFGEKTLDRSVFNDVAGTTPPFISMSDSDEIAGVYGLAVGGGWRRSGKRGDFFIETLYESQLWTSGGAPTLTFSGFEGLSLNLGLSLFLN